VPDNRPTMKRIGYTTGVYDLFHIGHVNLLRRARLECDYLIVGVTTDDLCIEAKGKAPIIPFTERMSVVESVKYVDMVVPQVNYDKLEAWRNHKFNVMFVGDDWKGTPKWVSLERDFSALGVEIVYFPYSQQTSSTRIRAILDSYEKSLKQP
jgi:glycerol-3-phosphate cytidylyltransferase